MADEEIGELPTPVKDTTGMRSSRITCNPLPTIGMDELRLLVSLLSSDNMLEGKEIEVFEKMLGKYLGARHCVSFGRARVALYAILKALGVNSTDEVILPAYTCFVVPNAVHFCKARPVYVDIDPSTFNINVDKVEEKITPSVKAIIPHHLFGQSADIKPICEIAHRTGTVVVEDCAQSLGASYNRKKVGTIGDVAFFSFDFSKNITTGQGGAAVTNSSDTAMKLREIRDSFHFPPRTYVYSTILALIRGLYFLDPSSSLTRALIGEIIHKYVTLASDARYFIREKSQSTLPSTHLFRLPNALAKIGIFQLQKLDYFNERRREIAHEYNESFSELGVPSIQETPDSEHVFLRYALSMKNSPGFGQFLKRHQIMPGNWFDYVVHPYSAQRVTLGYEAETCPNAENAAKTIVNIPNHPKMKDEDVEHVKRTLRLYFHATY